MGRSLASWMLLVRTITGPLKLASSSFSSARPCSCVMAGGTRQTATSLAGGMKPDSTTSPSSTFITV